MDKTGAEQTGNDRVIVDLGCGPNKVEGAIGVDNVDLPAVDVVHDLLSFPYPFEPEAVDDVYLRHVIEHFEFQQFQSILGEAYRILKPGGLVHIRVPHVFSVAAWSDPTHRSSFVFSSMNFLDPVFSKAYYKETTAVWKISEISTAVTLLNLKGYRLRKVDHFLSKIVVGILKFLLWRKTWPGAADLATKILPIFFVEIQWILKKVAG